MQAFVLIDDCKPVNIASGTPVSIRDVLRQVLVSTQCNDIDVTFDTTKPTMIPKRLIDISRMHELTGWSPRTPLSQGISKTVEWYRSYFNTKTPEDLYR